MDRKKVLCCTAFIISLFIIFGVIFDEKLLIILNKKQIIGLSPITTIVSMQQSKDLRREPSRPKQSFSIPRPFVPKGMSKDDYYPAACSVPEVVRETTRNQNCSPVDKLVYLKTHKTGSATLASIIQRYGSARNLVFALPASGVTFSIVSPFLRTMAIKKSNYNFLYCHARYNFKEMNALIPNSKHITILRQPVDQLELAFSYFGLGRCLKLRKEHSSHAFETFLRTPDYYMKSSSYNLMKQAHNGQIFDLGLEEKHFNDEKKIRAKIAELEKRMDLILIKEYFDESLILLAKALCWDLADMLYSIKVSRGRHKYNVTSKMTKKIRKWNKADLTLYSHFNQTLWRKIEAYGPDFYQDLKRFREMRSCMERECTSAILGLERNYMKPILSRGSAESCKQIFTANVSGLTNTFRMHQLNNTIEDM